MSLFEQVESTDFSVQLNLQTGRAGIKQFVHDAPEWFDLQNIPLHEILERISFLLKEDFNHNYENSHDAALTVYLLVLSRRDPIASKRAADMILAAEHPEAFFWSRQFAYLLS